ncbi:transcriptional regulator with XRE-family HTH domain [Paenibacillus rhizosphaerae]|uniref:Transcriptional regulator with XRE-family HTH domain n=1 Tax=Paenibacillus rhizosphaerae TaxID=297318 RepID=A0A839TKE0_9BACL|nr:helix-turn-helix transcriptional regulator [Paenibacillus rhizosphaerae]MBB3127255.1 transcriptional regulator with XRE-family HTH domain [Paenibacillus rhizosphaerae]
MEGTSSRMSLGEFLRSRRERLTPEDVGLVSYGRRRTSGLRREEVAQLAHIGTSWYTSLEQGRSVNPSEDVLNNIAKALRLTEDERLHLHLLARPVQQEKVEDQQLNIGLERVIRALEPNPAFVIGRYWDLLLWNEAAEIVFRIPPFSNHMQLRLNWMRHLLMDAKLGSDLQDWQSRAQILIAHFRADYAHFPNDTRFKELIEEFMQNSPLFRELWPLHDVQVVTDRHKQRYDPLIGEMEFEHVTLQPPANPDVKIMIYTASTDTAARLQSIMSNRKKD